MIGDGPCATVFPLRHARIAHVSDAVSGCSDLRAHHAREPLGRERWELSPWFRRWWRCRALGTRRGDAGENQRHRVAARRVAAVGPDSMRVPGRYRADRPGPRRTHSMSGDPPVFPVIVTVSYNEAARMLDGGERVDAVPLPAGILAWMGPFVAEHYKPEPKQRVRRNDPLADGTFRRDRR
jgi:hypothetical protein